MEKELKNPTLPEKIDRRKKQLMEMPKNERKKLIERCKKAGMSINQYIPTEKDLKDFEEKEKKQKCILCGIEFKGFGNNPKPATDRKGVCCDDCNLKIVIPARFLEAINYRKEKEARVKTLASFIIKTNLKELKGGKKNEI